MSLAVDIRRRVGDFTLDVAFEVPAGVTAILGRSGAGKSTVVAAVAGLARPDDGRIALDGAALFDAETRVNLPPRKRRVGVVFQDSRLFPHFSVRTNLLFGARRRGSSGGLSLDEVAEVLGIGHLLKRRPNSLSGGERQRVAIGRALLSRPSALLFDEPLAALDSERKAEVLPYIARLTRGAELPVLYVTHALEEARALADRLVVLEGGRVAASGPVEQAIAQAGLAAAGDRFADGVTLEAVIAELDEAYELTGVALGSHRVWTPGLLGRPGEAVRLRLLARDVSLALIPPERASIRNALPGLVRQVRRGPGPYAQVAVDVGGAVIKSEITRRAADDLGLAPGRMVHALVKSVAVARA
ncbi:molybdenum import ATP-binding protein ModC [Methylopila jiangsuensis]|uniref:Molybdenum import ATP-binding protein ModC n=1 Tax=Methylopila jiangsuensis TaxID=586230 RepID=A0A9W6JIR8_9HYPH|nr:molybdenum ABC transporter ATP-binding protein [Methylopila jiangsuensis]MDR6287093.1 molybdate transport system ATP-binding protein [Methylopila jiangsuensis]GLK76580.1 molybdenum import ATP-binding protein ModC [Methylopila jiangsuensis]